MAPPPPRKTRLLVPMGLRVELCLSFYCQRLLGRQLQNFRIARGDHLRFSMALLSFDFMGPLFALLLLLHFVYGAGSCSPHTPLSLEQIMRRSDTA